MYSPCALSPAPTPYRHCYTSRNTLLRPLAVRTPAEGREMGEPSAFQVELAIKSSRAGVVVNGPSLAPSCAVCWASLFAPGQSVTHTAD